MDSFSRFTQPALVLDKYFDHISNSFHEGMHKTDNNGELFRKYADRYGVSIIDCMVFDDSKNVNKVFSALGGSAYLITKEDNLASRLELLF
ncbi:MAG: hypothetical protein HY225_01210 [Candidatus Vogelbacteria bacterium]|nr:hypothetical protein [Candidatus Vogelbacteria bacterium]